MISHDSTIEQLIAGMTPAEKIGQMTQASNEAITPREVADLSIGSVLSGGNGNPTPNTPSVWADMVGSFVEAAGQSGIPLVYGVDAVHGHSNVGGATIFPHNIGLGSAGDEGLVERIGQATATEMRATGIRWTFAPTVAVPQDIRWGRTYEGYGRDPELVAKQSAALVRGLQGSGQGPLSVLACAKHFVGDGATTWGTAPRFSWEHWWDGWGDSWQIDQGDARISEEQLRSIHLRPYIAALEAGVMTVMASYNSWNGEKLHAHHGLLSGVLKEELGFRGFVVSDWMGVDQIDSDYETSVVRAINAGVDMVMVPDDYLRFIEVMKRVTASGRIPVERIDDAVRRILRAKLAAGLFDPQPPTPPLSAVGSTEHRALAAEAVRGSAVLLKNDGALPLAAGARSIEVAGRAADDIGLQCGGWTVGWQGGSGRTTAGTTLLDGLRASSPHGIEFDPSGDFSSPNRPDIGIVCIAEPPYAEGPGDRATPTASDEDRAVFARMRERADVLVLVVYSGRPLVIPDLIDRADAVVAAWLPGSEGAALGEVLSGLHRFSARTSQPWPRSFEALDDPEPTPLFPAGHGLSPTAADAGRNSKTTPPEQVND
ncbi:MAG: glycoside hydrolase family 3 protein [Acidimicrobiia bacterium]|nr:glycoside hydrolase family 3 protein [Acidimicrobiia bacterium]